MHEPFIESDADGCLFDRRIRERMKEVRDRKEGRMPGSTDKKKKEDKKDPFEGRFKNIYSK